MPIPTPNEGESQNDFMGRCHSAMKNEFKDQKQRTAVCFNAWRKKQGGKKPKSSFDLTFVCPITETRETSDTMQDFMIEGIAINPITTDNNHTFLPNELQSAAKSLEGKRLLKDHINSVDSIVGYVVNSHFDERNKNVPFKAVIKDDSMKKKIKDKLIDSVSIGASVESLEEENGTLVPKGINFKELSLVAVPADEGAKISTISQALNEAWESYSDLSEEKLKGGNMTDKKQETQQETKEEIKEETKEKVTEKELEKGVSIESKPEVTKEMFDGLKSELKVLSDSQMKMIELIQKIQKPKEPELPEAPVPQEKSETIEPEVLSNRFLKEMKENYNKVLEKGDILVGKGPLGIGLDFEYRRKSYNYR